MWRLVLEGTATLGDIGRDYSLADVYKANALLDMRADVQARQMEEARKK